MKTLEINENNFETLNTHYKGQLSEDDWAKVCFFEHHFMRANNIDVGTEAYGSLIAKNTLQYEHLKRTQNIAGELLTQSKNEITKRLKCKEVSGFDDQICVVGRNRHSPLFIELDVVNVLL